MNKNSYFDLVQKYTSPLYIFDYDVLAERIENLQKRSSKNIKLCYAIKANPFLIPALVDNDILFEVCSPGELSICEKYRVTPEKIVFSGVCKTYDDIERAYKLKVKTITLESKLHSDYLLQVIKNNPDHLHQQEVILRRTCGNQFGMSDSDIIESISDLLKFNNIKIRGIHYFTGTQKKIQKISDEIKSITSYCDELQKQMNITISDIEYGPGLSYNYFSTENECNNYSEYEQFVSLINESSYNFVIELGRYIASSCGEYITSIKDIKSDGEKRYCIIDGGINHINYYGQMLGMKTPLVEHINKNTGTENKKYCICGSLCTTADVILRELELTTPQVDDLLVFNNIGAYSITEGIYLFLSHSMPVILSRKGGSYSILRNKVETFSLNS